MNKAIIGKKIGMTQIFNQDGVAIPVTVIEAGPCPVIQKKNKERDGYEAVQVAFDQIDEKKVNRPIKGHYKKSGLTTQRFLRELKLSNSAILEIGSVIKCDIFKEGDKVDVQGTSKGHGFSGTIKRWNFHTGPMAHGSGYHRGVGSMGANSTPSKVIKNKKMPGQYGNDTVTVQNLEIVKILNDKNLILVKGSIPGSKGGLVIIKETCKN